jgi:radical SAM protein with 4Fe4S-binding SPASM domain
MRLRLSTNGTVIDERMAERIISSPAHSISVTFAGLTKEAYFNYHGVDALGKVIHSLKVLARAKRRHGFPKPRIRLRYLRFPFNIISRGELSSWLRRHLGEDGSFIDSLTVREGYLCGSTFSVQEIEKAYGISPGDLSPKTVPLYAMCLKNPSGPCIRADGAVFPCCAVPYKKEYVMGFLGEANFREIWNGSVYSAFRKSFREGKNPVCNSCFLRYPRMPLKLDRHFLQRIHARLRIG